MLGQSYVFNFDIEDKCEIEVDVTLSNHHKLSVDEISDLINQMSEEVYSSLVNISEE